HQDLAYGLGRDGVEMLASEPVPLGRPGDLDVRLMDEGRGLERVRGPGGAEEARRQAAQLVVHERQQLVQRPGVPGVGLLQEQGDLRVGIASLHGTLSPGRWKGGKMLSIECGPGVIASAPDFSSEPCGKVAGPVRSPCSSY